MLAALAFGCLGVAKHPQDEMTTPFSERALIKGQYYMVSVQKPQYNPWL